VDYQQWTPVVKQWSCFKTSGERNKQQSDDAIHVFLNFKKIGAFKDVKSAVACIQKLFDEAPVPLTEYRDYIGTP